MKKKKLGFLYLCLSAHYFSNEQRGSVPPKQVLEILKRVCFLQLLLTQMKILFELYFIAMFKTACVTYLINRLPQGFEFTADVTAAKLQNYTRKTIDPVHVCSQHMYSVLIGLPLLLLGFYRLLWLNEMQTTL